MEGAGSPGGGLAASAPVRVALGATLAFVPSCEVGLTGRPVLGGLKWASCPFHLRRPDYSALRGRPGS